MSDEGQDINCTVITDYKFVNMLIHKLLNILLILILLIMKIYIQIKLSGFKNVGKIYAYTS